MHITNNLDTSRHKCITDHNLSSPQNIENWAEATIITVRGMSLGFSFLHFRFLVANDQVVGTANVKHA